MQNTKRGFSCSQLWTHLVASFSVLHYQPVKLVARKFIKHSCSLAHILFPVQSTFKYTRSGTQSSTQLSTAGACLWRSAFYERTTSNYEFKEKFISVHFSCENDCKKIPKAFPPHFTASSDMLLTAFSAAWYAGLAILGFFGNLVVFLTTSVDRKLHLKRYVILASLALCDLLCAVSMMPFRSIARWKEAWVFGMPWCHASAIVVRVLYSVTMAHLCAISYDR